MEIIVLVIGVLLIAFHTFSSLFWRDKMETYARLEISATQARREVLDDVLVELRKNRR